MSLEEIKKMDVYHQLSFAENFIRDLRDNQNEILCEDEAKCCICLEFDLILDEIQSLKEKFDHEEEEDDTYDPKTWSD